MRQRNTPADKVAWLRVRALYLVFLAAVVGVGLVAILEGGRLGLYAEGVAGPGLLPVLLGCVLAVAAVMALRSRPTEASERSECRRSWATAAGIAAYIGLVYFAGFLLASAVFVVAIMYALGRHRYRVMLLTSGLVVALVYLIFLQWLHIPLPAGPWNL